MPPFDTCAWRSCVLAETILPRTLKTPFPRGESVDAAAEAQDEFTVILEEAGSQKIAVIKEVRNLNSALGLKEAKDLVDATPATLLEKVNKETADKAKAALEAAGAKVTLK